MLTLRQECTFHKAFKHGGTNLVAVFLTKHCFRILIGYNAELGISATQWKIYMWIDYWRSAAFCAFMTTMEKPIRNVIHFENMNALKIKFSEIVKQGILLKSMFRQELFSSVQRFDKSSCRNGDISCSNHFSYRFKPSPELVSCLEIKLWGYHLLSKPAYGQLRGVVVRVYRLILTTNDS